MAIQERLLELRFHLAFAVVLLAAVLYVLTLGPSLATVLGFFWPLLLSTGFFLAAVAILLRISPPPSDAAAEITGEDLMDYVTSHSAETLAENREAGESGVEDKATEAERGEEQALGHHKSR